MNTVTDIDKKRLIWRSRRGLLELDVLFEQFIKNSFNQLSDENLTAYAEILALPDTEILAIIHNRKHPEQKNWQPLITLLRNQLLQN